MKFTEQDGQIIGDMPEWCVIQIGYDEVTLDGDFTMAELLEIVEQIKIHLKV